MSLRDAAPGAHRERDDEIFDLADEWIAIDLETTGLDQVEDRIIEIGAVRYRNGCPVERYSTLVNPQRPLPARIAALTGLSDGRLEDAPPLRDALQPFLDFVGQAPVAGHNVSFDLAFLRAGAQAAGIALSAEPGATWPRLVLDTLEIARIVLPGHTSYALGVLSEPAEDEARHRALEDALAAGELLVNLWQSAHRLPLRLLTLALFWLDPACSQFPGLAAFLSGVRRSLASGVKPEQVVPVDSTDSAAPAQDGAPQAARRARTPTARGLMLEHTATAFAPEGFLAESVPGYEVRAEQQEMCDAVQEVMSTGGRLAVEAGTGVGKSLAYLVPAVAIAEAHDERVVISTHTVTLQDQLVEREVPLLANALGRPVRHAVLKGRSNYLCLRKWDDFFAGSLVAEETERLFGLRVLFWSAGTATGDVSELNLLGQESLLWPSVAGDEHCWGNACPRQPDCLILRSRAAALDADIVIANHALVCSDVLADGKLLPPYQHLIVDEAHHLEAVATDHFGLSVEETDVASLISSVLPNRGGGPSRLLMRHNSPSGGTEGARGWPSPGEMADVARIGVQAQLSARGFFAELGRFAAGRRRYNGEASGFELRYGRDGEPLPQACQTAAGELSDALRSLATKLTAIAERSPDGPTAGLAIAATARDCAVRAIAIDALSQAKDTAWVYWLTAGNTGTRLSGAPVSVADPLRTSLWARVKSVIVVSATLAIAGSFEHIVGQIGLAEPSGPPPSTLLLDSPFDFRSQVLLCVPRDLPLPGAAEADQAYSGAVAAFLTNLLPAVGGRSLVLFTSHRMLRQVYDLAAAELFERGLNLLAQGIDGGRTRLLRALRHEANVVVFGTSTFWEGIDVKGPQLSCLVITRLPFPRPDEPLTAARTERLEAAGRSAFGELSLPHAILRLKQGFGRLIRSADDRGAVVILDGRILRRSYGRLFVHSLPRASFYQGSRDGVVGRVAAWLEGETRPSGIRWVEPPSEGKR